MTDRAAHIHQARIYLRESAARRTNQRAFSFKLLDWAAARRRQAAATRAEPAQGALFR